MKGIAVSVRLFKDGKEIGDFHSMMEAAQFLIRYTNTGKEGASRVIRGFCRGEKVTKDSKYWGYDAEFIDKSQA